MGPNGETSPSSNTYIAVGSGDSWRFSSGMDIDVTHHRISTLRGDAETPTD